VLVQEQDGGVLGEGHGDPHPSALAAGELVEGAVRQGGRVGGRQGPVDDGFVRRGPLVPPALVRGAAAGDQVSYGDAVRSGRGLRQQREAEGEFAGGEGGDVGAVEVDGSGGGGGQGGGENQQCDAGAADRDAEGEGRRAGRRGRRR
jgi:hypothetical protein